MKPRTVPKQAMLPDDQVHMYDIAITAPTGVFAAVTKTCPQRRFGHGRYLVMEILRCEFHFGHLNSELQFGGSIYLMAGNFQDTLEGSILHPIHGPNLLAHASISSKSVANSGGIGTGATVITEVLGGTTVYADSVKVIDMSDGSGLGVLVAPNSLTLASISFLENRVNCRIYYKQRIVDYQAYIRIRNGRAFN